MFCETFFNWTNLAIQKSGSSIYFQLSLDEWIVGTNCEVRGRVEDVQECQFPMRLLLYTGTTTLMQVPFRIANHISSTCTFRESRMSMLFTELNLYHSGAAFGNLCFWLRLGNWELGLTYIPCLMLVVQGCSWPFSPESKVNMLLQSQKQSCLYLQLHGLAHKDNIAIEYEGHWNSN